MISELFAIRSANSSWGKPNTETGSKILRPTEILRPQKFGKQNLRPHPGTHGNSERPTENKTS